MVFLYFVFYPACICLAETIVSRIFLQQEISRDKQRLISTTNDS